MPALAPPSSSAFRWEYRGYEAAAQRSESRKRWEQDEEKEEMEERKAGLQRERVVSICEEKGSRKRGKNEGCTSLRSSVLRERARCVALFAEA